MGATAIDTSRSGSPAESADPAGVDVAARDRCFRSHLAPQLGYVQRICRHLSSNNADAEDLAQETMLRAYRAADRFDGRYPKAWLYRIARNAAINRDSRRRDLLLSEDHPGPIEETTPADTVLAAQLDPLLVDALAKLPDHGRRVIELVDGEQLSYEEAAAVLDVPRGTIMSRLHRARKRLLKELEGTHLDRSAVRSGLVVPLPSV